ncbi:MAG: DUF2334 domain-containing protein [Ilumatobacteraceae bacterium]
MIGDSTAWALGRFDAGLANFAAAGLGRPTIFEFPHYAASVTDYAASAQRFSARYERITYFQGSLGGTENYGNFNAGVTPYVGTDVWGVKIIPENLGYVITGIRSPADIVADAGRMKAVRDSVASFFYHPYLGVAGLQTVVEGMQRQGWTFVAPTSL